MAKQSKFTPGRYQGRDPQTGEKMLDGITAIVSHVLNVTYQARWEWTGPGGKRMHGSKILKTRAEAERYKLEQELAHLSGAAAREAMTLNEYATRWANQQRKSRKWRASTMYNWRTSWDLHFGSTLGHHKLAEITKYDCQLAINALQDRGLKASTIARLRKHLSTILSAAEDDELVPRNVARRLVMPVDEDHEQVSWSVSQAQRFLAAQAGTPSLLLWQCLLYTGCRIGEIVVLRWSDIDFDRSCIFLRTHRSIDETGVEIVIDGTKTGNKAEVVPLAPSLARWLLEARTAALNAKVVDINGYVFTSPKAGGHLRYVTAYARFRRTIARFNANLPEEERIPEMAPHGFRHTAASLLIAEGVSDLMVQRILRHKTITTTKETYVHTDMMTLNREIARLDGALDATTSSLETTRKSEPA